MMMMPQIASQAGGRADLSAKNPATKDANVIFPAKKAKLVLARAPDWP